MAIAVVVEFKGATAEQYDQVIAKLGLTPGGAAMPGQLSHWVSVTDDGTRITDVWESRETFEKFAQEKMVPPLLRWAFLARPLLRSTMFTTTSPKVPKPRNIPPRDRERVTK